MYDHQSTVTQLCGMYRKFWRQVGGHHVASQTINPWDVFLLAVYTRIHTESALVLCMTGLITYIKWLGIYNATINYD